MKNDLDRLKKQLNDLVEVLSKKVQPVIEDNVGQKLVELFSIMSMRTKEWAEGINLDETELKNALKVLRYYCVLDKVSWPVFDNKDKNFHKDVIEMSDNSNYEELDKYIIDYYDNNRLNEILSYIASIENNEDKLALFQNAFSLYENKEYYGVTSILVCQFNGIINDIFEINKIIDDKEGKKNKIQKQLKRSGNIEKETEQIYLNSEKNRMVWECNIVGNNIIYWQAITKYLYSIIYYSGKKYSQKDPCRNKICHGEQVCYGTQIHALKSLLIVHTLYCLKEEHIRISKSDKEKN